MTLKVLKILVRYFAKGPYIWCFLVIRQRGVSFTCLRVENLHNLCRIPLPKRFVFLPPFITLFSHFLLYQSRLKRYLFHILSYSSICHYLFRYSNDSNTGYGELFQLTPSYNPIILAWRHCFNAFLFSGALRCSRLILYIP